MATNDSAFKVLVQQEPQAFVKRFLPGAVFRGMLPTELSREPLRSDALLHVSYPAENGTDYVLHLEVQTKADATMPRRLCTYGLLAMEQQKLPVLSTVIYLERCATPQTPWQVYGPTGLLLEYHFHIVRLWEEDLDEWMALDAPGLLVFAPLLHGASIDRIDQVIAAIDTLPDPAQRANHLHYLMHFAKRSFGATAVNDYLRRHPVLDQIIQEWPFYQEILAKGELNGEVKGRQNGMRTNIIALISQRFPSLLADAEKHVITITDLQQLSDMVVQVALAPDEASARASLGLIAQ